ncbi:putative DNA polymerase III delta' subunit [Desulfovibrio sp. A2]|nr:putative DNA polymerase III delta' subunit [Desulfovibrio sp. A2]
MANDTTTAPKRGRAAAATDAPPAPQDPREAVAPLLAPRHQRTVGHLHALAAAPPQVVLAEGGAAPERMALALYWAALLNCEAPEGDGTDGARPCLACPACLRMAGGGHRDLIVLDGNKPSAEEGSFSIDNVRALRGLLGEPPREARRRVVVLVDAHTRVEAANGLLKSLEEPRPTTCFVLLAPQRERLLPTLVSRSFVLTLAWPTDADPPSPAVRGWLDALVEFIQTGGGWMERTSRKGDLDAPLAAAVVLHCQRTLADVLAGRAADPLGRLLAERMDLARLRRCDEALAAAQEALSLSPSPVNPALVMDWLATRLFLGVR